MRLLIMILILIVGASLVVFTLNQSDSQPQIRAGLVKLRSPESLDQFPPPETIEAITFPKDFGAHPAYKTESWAYYGQLVDEQGNRYGLQFSIFRFGLTPGITQRASEWSTNQIYVASFSLTQVSDQTFTQAERFSRGNNRLAGVETNPYRVWLEDWSVSEIGPDTFQINIRTPTISLDVQMTPTKPAILPTAQSLLNPEEGYAYTLSSNSTTGTITVGGEPISVTGHLWHHHRWGKLENLTQEELGWDWFSLSLDNNQELTYFATRRQDGTPNPDSIEIILIDEKGVPKRLSPAAISLTSSSQWESLRTQAQYPTSWTLDIPDEGLKLSITPTLVDQELDGLAPRWVGLVTVEGTSTGHGYIELTGYVIDQLRNVL
ncbi:MAG: lipocalin-like domain-containing protein [Chloroflexota bacterium]